MWVTVTPDSKSCLWVRYYYAPSGSHDDVGLKLVTMTINDPCFPNSTVLAGFQGMCGRNFDAHPWSLPMSYYNHSSYLTVLCTGCVYRAFCCHCCYWEAFYVLEVTFCFGSISEVLCP